MEEKISSKAIWTLILSICFFVSASLIHIYIGFFSFFSLGLGVIFLTKDLKTKNQKGKGIAITGIILSILTILLAIVVIIISQSITSIPDLSSL